MLRNSPLKKSKFSRPQIIVFAAAFALMGYLIFRTFAASNPNLPGDLNNDNTVNGADLSLLLSNYGTTNAAGDVNGDGTVNAVDLSSLLSHYGQTYSQSKPSIPTGFTAAAGNGSVTLKWNPNPTSEQVDVYQAYINDSNSPPSNLSVSGTSYTFTGLTNGTSYNFRVSAHNAAGYGGWTDAISVTPTGGGGGTGSVLWRGDFETGNTSQYNGADNTGGLQAKVYDGSRFSAVTSPVRQGKYAGKFTIYPGDNNVFGSLTWERVELLLPQAESGGYEGQENWYAYSVYYPSSTPHGAGGSQWHPTGAGGSGQTGIKTYGSILGMGVYGQCCAPDGTTTWFSRDFLTYQTDKWYDIVFHVKWSDTSAGFTELFINGARVSPLQFSPNMFAVDDGVYMKFGIYRAPQTYAESIIMDGMLRASSYSAAITAFPASSWPSTPPQ